MDVEERDTNSKLPTYFSLNPGTFSEPDLWAYRDIQKLCKRLGLNAGGKREDLVERLEQWHTDGRHGDTAECGRFGLIGVELHNPKDKSCKVSPSLLSPFTTKTLSRRADGTLNSPRSILKRRLKAKCPLSAIKNLNSEKGKEDSKNCTPKQEKRKRRKLGFSPYNMVRVISPRRPGDCRVKPNFENEDDEDDSEESSDDEQENQ
eukprot:g1247.t1